MTHYTDWEYNDIANAVGMSAHHLLKQLADIEDMYQRLTNVYTVTGGTDQDFANELFNITEGDSATAEQVAKVADLRQAIQAMHQINEAANNVAVPQANRVADLQRLAMPQVVGQSRR